MLSNNFFQDFREFYFFVRALDVSEVWGQFEDRNRKVHEKTLFLTERNLEKLFKSDPKLHRTSYDLFIHFRGLFWDTFTKIFGNCLDEKNIHELSDSGLEFAPGPQNYQKIRQKIIYPETST